MPTIEVLAGGPAEPAFGSPRRWPRALAVTLVALAVVGWGADRLVHRHEVTQLQARSALAVQADDYARRYVLSTLDYVSPNAISTRLSAEVRAGIQQLVKDAAAGQVAPLQSRRDAVASVRVLPWHSDVEAARRAELAALDTDLAALRAVSSDFDQIPELGAAAAERASAAQGVAALHR